MESSKKIKQLLLELALLINTETHKQRTFHDAVDREKAIEIVFGYVNKIRKEIKVWNTNCRSQR